VTTFNLYPYLILVGGSILAATAWLLYQARSQAQRSQSLVQLNEQLAFDLPDFLRQCWPALQKGGFAGLHWRLDWYGVTLSGAQQRSSPEFFPAGAHGYLDQTRHGAAYL
jgi:hypothetical protein